MRSQLVIQRNNDLLVTPGEGRDQLASLVRWCGQLKAIIAGNYAYELSPVALWGTAARGIPAGRLLEALAPWSPTPIPATFAARVAEIIGRYGALELVDEGDGLRLRAADRQILIELGIDRDARLSPVDAARLKVESAFRGWPVVDRRHAGSGNRIDIAWCANSDLRAYQRAAVDAFLAAGSGVVLLPCGAGKTLVGVAAAASTGRRTLVLTPSRAVAEQWREAFLEYTTQRDSEVRIASGAGAPAPVTIQTYHSATLGAGSGQLVDGGWGMVIYDEVQSLPADVFRLAAAFQSTRRLGLTATLVREDGREGEIFALVGPILYDVPWVELEAQGWLAPARCIEVRIPEAQDQASRLRYRLAVVDRLLHRHRDDPTLVVGSDLSSLRAAASAFDLPLVTGRTRPERREARYQQFRQGHITRLALSKVGSVGIDLPEASALIQLSGTYGSRQEEAQRLGRLLRPGTGKTAHFYTLVPAGTRDEEFARRRQRFLVDQGYQYEILDAADLPRVPRGGSG